MLDHYFILVCALNAERFMKATSLRDCLTSLGGDPNFYQIQYIETFPENEDFLTNVCQNIYPQMKYDKIKTEKQNDSCTSDAYMYPSTCDGSEGWLNYNISTMSAPIHPFHVALTEFVVR